MIYHYVVLSLILFSLGLITVIVRRNLIVILIGIEFMLNSVGILFVSYARFYNNYIGEFVALVIMLIAACEMAIGLSIVVAMFRIYGSVKSNDIRELKN
ncbi:MAG: NADH-quinone oxidoreductase subunit NuoK [Deltaproteobacteria bacterium]|nr:NADH-quinone oxidoreductase subunit NuoK [Deltaproteobacteria bacterium]